MLSQLCYLLTLSTIAQSAGLLPNILHDLLDNPNRPGGLSFNIGKRTAPSGWRPRFLRGLSAPPALSVNNFKVLSIELDLGFWQKPVPMEIDTGSADLWVFPELFDPSTSFTFRKTGQSAETCFPAMCYDGYKGTDIVKVGDTARVFDANIYVGKSDPKDPQTVGLLGLSYTDYDNFPVQLKNSGIIERAAYSIWLNGPDHNGTISFGGVDTTKYTGQLTKVKIAGIPDDNGQYPANPDRIATPLNGIRVKDESGNVQDVVTDMAQPIWLDTGSTGFGMHRDWIDALMPVWGCSWDDTINGPRCDYKPNQGSIIFNFSGLEVEIDIERMASQASLNGQWYNIDGRDQWWLALEDYTEGRTKPVDQSHPAIFGSFFFNSVFVSVDLDGQEIAMAKAVTGDVPQENIVDIDAASGIPGCVEAPQFSVSAYHNGYSVHSATAVQTAA